MTSSPSMLQQALVAFLILQAALFLFPKASRFRELATLSLALQLLPLLTPRRKMKMLIPATASQRNSSFIAMISQLK
jgi:hypothetical protein